MLRMRFQTWVDGILDEFMLFHEMSKMIGIMSALEHPDREGFYSSIQKEAVKWGRIGSHAIGSMEKFIINLFIRSGQ